MGRVQRTGREGLHEVVAVAISEVAWISSVATGDAWIDPQVASRVLSAYRGSVPREPADVSVLTDRELDVLRSVGRGLNNREAAAELFVSEATLKTHLRLVLTKLDLRDRSAAIVFAHDNDIL